MPKTAINDKLDGSGSRPNPAAPGFVEEARRHAQLLRDVPEEIEALDFIEAVANSEGWTD